MTASNVTEGAARPFRVNFIGVIPQDRSQLYDNVGQNANCPLVQPAPIHDRALAIVGGGPSLAQTVELLKDWPGDIWAINLTGRWLHERGIKSTVYSVDASENPSEMAPPEAVTDAIFSSWCAPNVVKQYDKVRVFHMWPIVLDGIVGGTTSAVSAPLLALKMGYKDVTFFGCESSYVDSDHVDRHEQRAEELIVRANEKLYRTTPPFYIQAQELSRIIKEFPQVFKEQSGGLLRGMIQDDNWEVVQVSEKLAAHFDEVNEKGIEELAKQYEGRM